MPRPARKTSRPAPGADAPLTANERLARAKALDLELCRLHRDAKRREARMARRLFALEESRGYVALGFGSLLAYAKQRFGWGRGKVRDLKTLLRRLERLPVVAKAFFSGELDWTKAVRVARATEGAPEQQAHWLGQALARSTEELDQAIAESKGEQRRVRLVLHYDAAELALLDEACRALRSEGLELDRSAAVLELARRALQGGSAGKTTFRVHLTHDPDAETTTQETNAGEVTLAPALASRLLCNAEVQDPSGRVTRTIPRRVQNRLIARSQGRCEVPGCRNRAYLESHHNRGWRAGHDLEHLLHLCSTHHGALHQGSLRIVGSWSKGLCFLRADGSVLGVGGAPTLKSPRRTRSGTEAPPPQAGPRAPDEAVSRETGAVAQPARSGRVTAPASNRAARPVGRAGRSRPPSPREGPRTNVACARRKAAHPPDGAKGA